MIVKNMPFAEYLSHPAVNNSLLKLVAKAPKLARAYLDGEYKVEQTAAMRRGTLVHTLVLEPGSFQDRYVIAPESDRRTKAGKAEFEEFSASVAGREIVTPDELNTARSMADAVLSHPSASLLWHWAESEVSVFETIDGVECKCRVDIKRDDGNITDLKTATDASPAGFSRQCVNLDYVVAAAFYMDLAELAGIPATDCVWVVVESATPYLVATYRADPRDIEIGRIMYRERLETLKQCRATGIWPGIGDGRIETLKMPKWFGANSNGEF